MRTALLLLALAASACTSDSRPEPAPSPPPGASNTAVGAEGELTKSARVTLRVIGMT